MTGFSSVFLSILFCIFFPYVVYSASSTKFNFSGTITCNATMKDSFVEKLQVWEHDKATPNDMIGEVAQFIKDKSGFFYKVDAEDNGDGLFDNDYEIYFTIYHNCTEKRTGDDVTVYVKDFLVIDGAYNHTMDINLSDLTKH